MNSTHVVLIPALEPDARLVALVRMLPGPVLVVDDGSSPEYRPVFAEAASAGAVVIAHPINRGKGAALRTGFAEISRRWPGADVVTADADGQHTPVDITRVAQRLARTHEPDADRHVIVLGARAFAGGDGARSRFGNSVMRGVFRLATGTPLRDTQTGLRGYPAALLPWLASLRGDRFEYELTMLLRARGVGVRLTEVPIETVYLDDNASSHFRPIVDSIRVMAPLLRFAGSALLAFAIDTVMLLVLNTLTGWLLFSVVGARVVSASVNFTINRRLVFDPDPALTWRRSAARYVALALLLLMASFGTLTALADAGAPMLAAKILTDAALFAVSFAVQRSVVFAPAASALATPDASPRATGPITASAGMKTPVHSL